MKKLDYPFSVEAVRELKVGDMVLISGKLFTGRDAVHKYLHDGNKPPVDLKNQIIYHCGPVTLQDKKGKWTVTAAGPTTSIREEPYQWEVIRDYGIVGVIGKGGMGQKTLDACKQYGCVYFHAVGGAAQVLAEKIKSVDGLYLKEFGFLFENLCKYYDHNYILCLVLYYYRVNLKLNILVLKLNLSYLKY